MNIKAKFSVLKASHPFSVIMASFAGGIISWKILGEDILVFKILVIIILTQFLTGFVNDYLDYSSDLLFQPTKPTVRNIVELQDLKQAIIMTIILIIIATIAFLPPLGMTVVIIGILVAQSYNLGLKDTPFSALIFVISFGLMAVLPFFVAESVEFANLPFKFIISGFLISLSIHLTNDLVDFEIDKKRNAKPLTVVLGQNKAIITIFLLAFLFTIIQYQHIILLLIQLSVAFTILIGIKNSSYQIREMIYYIVASLHVLTLYLLSFE